MCIYIYIYIYPSMPQYFNTSVSPRLGLTLPIPCRLPILYCKLTQAAKL